MRVFSCISMGLVLIATAGNAYASKPGVGDKTEITTGAPREIRYSMAVKDANDTSLYETKSGSQIIIGRAARARADLIKKIRESGANVKASDRQRQGRIVNDPVGIHGESRIVNDPEKYEHIPPFGGVQNDGGYQPSPLESIKKDDTYFNPTGESSFVPIASQPQQTFSHPNIIDGGFRPQKSHDDRIINTPVSLPSLGPIPPAPQDECVCVPVYQCGQDGYLTHNPINDGGSNAGSYPPQLPPLSPPPKRSDHHDQSFLDIDERSNVDDEELEGRSGKSLNLEKKEGKEEKKKDDKTRARRELPSLNERFIGDAKDDKDGKEVKEEKEANSTEAPAYATEIMQRMLGVNFGQCGVLKVCCKIPPNFDQAQLPAGIVPVKTPLFAPDRKNINSFNDYDNGPTSGKQVNYPPAFVPSGPISNGFSYPRPIDSFIPQQPAYPTCGARNSYGVHGRVANLNYPESGTDFAEFPWHVGIMKRLGPQESLYVCGGVLIASQWIATAAHCLKSLRPQELKVRLGEWDVHREDEFYAHVEKLVVEIVVHPEFFPGNLNNDIALLKLDGPVDLNAPHIAAACLPEKHDNFLGKRCWVTGWGKDAFGTQGAYQHVLRKVDVPMLEPLDCQDRLRKTRLGPFFKLHTSFVCAGGEPGKDACTGDGGSPMVCEQDGVWKVVGLVSWGIGCGTPGVPGVYVNMAKFRPWVEEVLSNLSA